MNTLPKEIENIINDYQEKPCPLVIDMHSDGKLTYEWVNNERVRVIDSRFRETKVTYIPPSLCKKHFRCCVTYIMGVNDDNLYWTLVEQIGDLSGKIGSLEMRVACEGREFSCDENEMKEVLIEFEKFLEIFDFLGHMYY